MCVIALGALIYWFKVWKPNQPVSLLNPVSLFNLVLNELHYVAITLYTIVILIRKIQNASKDVQNSDSIRSASLPSTTKENLSLFPALIHPSNREVKAYRGFAIYNFLTFIISIMYILTAVGALSAVVWRYSFHILLLAGLTLSAFIFIDYTKERTSFQAKLVGVVLCVVLIVLGLLPYSLFGEGLPTRADPHPENKLKNFLLLIPAVTFIIVIILPLVFHYHILRPLGEVVKGVQQVYTGNLSTTLKVEVNDEIGSLSKHFNQMTQSLREYFNKMEDLVSERTSQLQASLNNLKATQAQLIQSEKMASLGELTAGIAHEIQNPLNFVNNFSEVNTELIDEMQQALQSGNTEEAFSISNDLKDNEQKIMHHGKRADAIVKGMLQHSRISTGQKEPTDINALADEYLRLSFHGMRAKDKTFNATLQTDFDASIEKINIIPQDIGRVLLNLYNNAFYAVTEKKKQVGDSYEPTVSVSTKKINGKVEIRVKDNGNGIPQKIVDKIFQPFFTTKPTGQGTGLGLSLSYDIVKAHGGEVRVETKEGEGSEFVIQLPA
jgi:two-component system NtrC family sensor kinase